MIQTITSFTFVMDFKNALIVDTVTGTVLNISGCVLLQSHNLTEFEWDEFASMSDSEICSIAAERGQNILEIISSCFK